MKKNKIMRIASVLLVAVLLSTCAISGTFAKYTTTASGTSTARVAKWDVDITNGTQNQTFAFNLFENVQDTKNNASEGEDYTESDVKKESNKNIIAPGTQGSFRIQITNKSEVNAKYTIDYTVTNIKRIPVKFSVNNGEDWTDDLTDVTDDLPIDNQTVDITVMWKWAFEAENDNDKVATDATDTSLGEVTEDVEITVTATVTVEQVD